MAKATHFASASVADSGASPLPDLALRGAATAAHFQAEDGAIRFRLDGEDATSTDGFLLPAGSDLLVRGDLDQVSLAATTGTVKVNVHYFA